MAAGIRRAPRTSRAGRVVTAAAAKRFGVTRMFTDDDSRVKRLTLTLLEARGALRECADLAFAVEDELYSTDERKFVLRKAFRDMEQIRAWLEEISGEVAGL